MVAAARDTLRIALASLVAIVALLAAAGPALAVSASISVTDANGRQDPAAYMARVFTISGAAFAGQYLYVKHHQAGGAPCAPTAYSDTGRLSTGFYGVQVSGAFQTQHAWTWDAPGSWTFCMWIASSETAIASPIAQTIAFRTPGGAIASSVSPTSPRVGERTQVTVAGSSEAPRRIWVKLRPAAGEPCAPTYDMDGGQSVIDGWDADGPFAAKRDVTQWAPGTYLICDWLAGSSFDPWPIAGPQATTFTVSRLSPVVSSVAMINCRTHRPIAVLRAGQRTAMCVRYRFARPPDPGVRVAVTYITPKRRTYKTVTAMWRNDQTPTITTQPLPSRAYKHRRGTWRAILRVGDTQLKSTPFHVR
jgi:hypothetical protein